MNISFTKRQREYIKAKVKTGLYYSASEVVREALRVLETAEADRDRLEALIDEADLDPAVPIGKTYWTDLKAELRSERGRKKPAA